MYFSVLKMKMTQIIVPLMTTSHSLLRSVLDTSAQTTSSIHFAMLIVLTILHIQTHFRIPVLNPYHERHPMPDIQGGYILTHDSTFLF